MWLCLVYGVCDVWMSKHYIHPRNYAHGAHWCALLWVAVDSDLIFYGYYTGMGTIVGIWDNKSYESKEN